MHTTVPGIELLRPLRSRQHHHAWYQTFEALQKYGDGIQSLDWPGCVNPCSPRVCAGFAACLPFHISWV